METWDFSSLPIGLDGPVTMAGVMLYDLWAQS